MFRLRELERKDLPIINRWRNDAELIALLGAPFRYINLDVDMKWFDGYMSNRGNAVRCAITKENDDTILGLVSLVSINYMNQSAEFHIMIGDKENQGQGMGTFAVNEMLKHAFYNMNLQRVELTVLEDNERARHLYEKCGFVYEGRKRQAKFKNGRFLDMLLYSILRQEYSGGGTAASLINRFCIDEVKSAPELYYIIKKCDNAFEEPVHQRRIYSEITDKLIKNAKILVAYDEEILGYNAFYCNNSVTKTAYISLIAVDSTKQNKHIGQALLKVCEDICVSNGMLYLDLEVRKNNNNAIRFYENNKFYITEEKEDSYMMRKKLF